MKNSHGFTILACVIVCNIIYTKDSVLVENMHDIPYMHTHEVGPEVVSAMTRACSRVRHVFDTGPVGVQILAGANKQALAVAMATGKVTC